MRRTLKSIAGLLRGMAPGGKVPLKVQHFVTLRCNLRCRYCGLWKENPAEMTTKEAKELMDALAGMGTVAWTFTGGEPLMRPDIRELVEHAKSLDLMVTLTTNGKLVSEDMQWLRRIDVITVSLDGSEEAHDNNRGRGSYKEAVKAIRVLKSMGCNVAVGAVLSRELTTDGCAGLRRLLMIIEELDVKALFLPMYDDSFNADNQMGDMMPTADEYAQCAGILRQFKAKAGARLMMSGPAIDWVADFHAMRPTKCFAGRMMLTVYPDGSMATCMFRQETRTKTGTPEERFKSLRTFGRCACKANCYVETNNLFGLRPQMLIDYLRQQHSLGGRR